MRLVQVFDYNAFAEGEEADVDADAAAAAAEQEAKLREEKEKAKARDRYVDSINRLRATGPAARGSVDNASGLAAVAPKQKVRYILFFAAVVTSQVCESPWLTRSAPVCAPRTATRRCRRRSRPFKSSRAIRSSSRRRMRRLIARAISRRTTTDLGAAMYRPLFFIGKRPSLRHLQLIVVPLVIRFHHRLKVPRLHHKHHRPRSAFSRGWPILMFVSSEARSGRKNTHRFTHLVQAR